MKKFIPTIALISIVASSAALAQTNAPSPSTTPSPPPAREVTPPASTPSMGTSTSTTMSAPTLTDDQARAWVDKVIYSSDDKNIGEVAAFQRDSSGKVTELHADIGGLLGLGETRVRVMPEQFKLVNDRVVLNLSSEQAKTLPKIAK